MPSASSRGRLCDASQLAPSLLPPRLSTSPRVRPQRCCTLKSRTRGTSVSAPIRVARIIIIIMEKRADKQILIQNSHPWEHGNWLLEKS